MRNRIAMILCLVLALGWISDTGLLTLKIGREQVIGIPTRVGYSYTLKWGHWITTFTPMPIVEAITLGWEPLLLVNGSLVPLTRLGKGWLFQFKELEEACRGCY